LSLNNLLQTFSHAKDIELRKWNTSFRGEFLIHASKTIDIESSERLDMNSNKFTIGAIIGSAFLYDVKEYSNREEFEKDRHKHFSVITKYFEGYRYGFLIRDAKLLKNPTLIQALRFLKLMKI
jgi:hypothetical protein